MPQIQAHSGISRYLSLRSDPRLLCWRVGAFSICAVILLLCGFAGVGQAADELATATPAPLVIEADRVVINDKTGVSVYKGNVQVTRGSLHLSCDDLTVHNSNGEVQQSECNGHPAKFHRDREGNKKEVHGYANRVEYYLQDEHVVLLGEAHLEQDRDTFSGQHIIYYLKRDVVNADAAGRDDSRVRITIHPKQDEGVKDKKTQ